jgi:hypothetical protein
MNDINISVSSELGTNDTIGDVVLSNIILFVDARGAVVWSL